MGKFTRVSTANQKFIRTAEDLFSTGVKPEVLSPTTPSVTDLFGKNNQIASPTPENKSKVKAPNYFELAGLDPSGRNYTGKASENEKLRQAIDAYHHTNSPTFYDAYVKNIGNGHWTQHPNERIDELSGKSSTPSPAPKSTVAPSSGSGTFSPSIFNSPKPINPPAQPNVLKMFENSQPVKSEQAKSPSKPNNQTFSPSIFDTQKPVNPQTQQNVVDMFKK